MPPSKNVRSKSAPSPKGAARPGVLARLLRGWLKQPGRFLTATLGIACLALLPSLPWLAPNLAQQPEFQFAVREVQIPAGHRWLPPKMVEEVVQQAQLPEKVSLLDRHLAGNLALAWSQHPWVKEVKSVRVEAGGVRADVTYREPAAFVEVLVNGQQGLYPVDQQGVLLPPADFSLEETELLPHIRGVQSSPRGPAGTSWGDEVVVQAARLAVALAPAQNLDLYWKRFGLEAILAPARGESGQKPVVLTFELTMRNGNRIVWGQAPGADSLEQPADKKLARLEWLAEKGKLTAPGGPWSIDIRPFGDHVDQVLLDPLHRVLR